MLASEELQEGNCYHRRCPTVRLYHSVPIGTPREGSPLPQRNTNSL
jgi:hypothetical protein